MAPRYELYAPRPVRGPSLRLPGVRQLDDCSCGLVAVLTVAMAEGIPEREALAAIGSPRGGMCCDAVVRALRRLGFRPERRDDLAVRDLVRLVRLGVPVLLTVYPAGWDCDHWTVVRGFSCGGGRVHLTNYGSLPVARFEREWFDRGEGVVLS